MFVRTLNIFNIINAPKIVQIKNAKIEHFFIVEGRMKCILWKGKVFIKLKNTKNRIGNTAFNNLSKEMKKMANKAAYEQPVEIIKTRTQIL